MNSPDWNRDPTDSVRLEWEDAENGILDSYLDGPYLWTHIESPGEADLSMRWDDVAIHLESRGAVPPAPPFQEDLGGQPQMSNHDLEPTQMTPPAVTQAADSDAEARPTTSGPQRLESRRRGDFTLSAASGDHPRYVQAWLQGRLIRQKLGDGTISLTVEYEDTAHQTRAGAHIPLLMRLRGPSEATQPFHLLLILVPPAERANTAALLVGQAIVADLAALGELDPPELLSTEDLGAADIAVVPDSVAAARGAWDTAWRLAARAAGNESPLYAAVLRGIRAPEAR